jgi:hypothetical protein
MCRQVEEEAQGLPQRVLSPSTSVHGPLTVVAPLQRPFDDVEKLGLQVGLCQVVAEPCL